ncbi:MAG: hypothetical protein NTZ27_00145 [Ignavibacteriales bacterium]|nr:hypothetical protein [Ignavibacteriales bacterium]
MQDTAFVTLVSWVIAHGYFILFIATLVEGPFVTAAAGVAAALGYFSLPLIILVSVAGDLVADVAIYAVGYFGGKPFVEQYGHYVGLTSVRMKKLEILLHKNLGKAMIFVKLTPAIPVAGLLMIGSMRAPLKRFAEISLLITFPKSILFALIGFYSGKAYTYLSGSIAIAQYLLFVGVLLIIAVYFINRWAVSYFVKKMNENEEDTL